MSWPTPEELNPTEEFKRRDRMQARVTAPLIIGLALICFTHVILQHTHCFCHQ